MRKILTLDLTMRVEVECSEDEVEEQKSGWTSLVGSREPLGPGAEGRITQVVVQGVKDPPERLRDVSSTGETSGA